MSTPTLFERLASTETLLTVDKLAEFLCISPRTIRNWLTLGVCPIRPLKIKTAVRFDPAEVAAYLEEMKLVFAQAQKVPDLPPQPPRRGRGRPRKAAQEG